MEKSLKEENQALIQNHTWDLVPRTDNLHVVQCKWVFRTRWYKADGTVDKYKARLVAKGFQQTLVLICLRPLAQLLKLQQS